MSAKLLWGATAVPASGQQEGMAVVCSLNKCSLPHPRGGCISEVSEAALASSSQGQARELLGSVSAEGFGILEQGTPSTDNAVVSSWCLQSDGVLWRELERAGLDRECR